MTSPRSKKGIPKGTAPQRHKGLANPPPPPIKGRFPKGVSGNPGGRPKLLGESYKAWLRRTEEGETKSNAERVAEALGAKAILAGDVAAASEIRRATEGESIRLFSAMSDEELDSYIAERERELTDAQKAAETVIDGALAAPPLLAAPAPLLPIAKQQEIELLLAQGLIAAAQRKVLEYVAETHDLKIIV